MPALAPLGWQFKGACNYADPELFFAFPTETERIAEAKAVCQSCPVQSVCAGYALDAEIKFGIWGGLTEQERAQMQRGQRRPANAIEDWQADHGTSNGERWHRRHDEPLCGPCRANQAARMNARFAARDAERQAEAVTA